MVLRDKLRIWAFQGIIRLAALLPLSRAQRVGTALGNAMYWLPNAVQNTVRKNVQVCQPHLSTAEREVFIKSALQEFGKTIAETGATWVWPQDRLFDLIRESPSCRLFHDAVAKNRGVLIITPHIAGWELVGLYFSSLYPVTCLYRPPHRQDLDPFLQRSRSRTGAKLAPTSARGVRALYSALRKGEVAGILPDQDPGRDNGQFAPFFGVQTNTMTLVSRLAEKSGAVVLFSFAERLPNGDGFTLHCFEGDPAIGQQPLERSLSILNAQIEKAIAVAPTQYLWSYKRFKTRPAGEEKFY